jgi:hypothetical protein
MFAGFREDARKATGQLLFWGCTDNLHLRFTAKFVADRATGGRGRAGSMSEAEDAEQDDDMTEQMDVFPAGSEDEDTAEEADQELAEEEEAAAAAAASEQEALQWIEGVQTKVVCLCWPCVHDIMQRESVLECAKLYTQGDHTCVMIQLPLQPPVPVLQTTPATSRMLLLAF